MGIATLFTFPKMDVCWTEHIVIILVFDMTSSHGCCILTRPLRQTRTSDALTPARTQHRNSRKGRSARERQLRPTAKPIPIGRNNAARLRLENSLKQRPVYLYLYLYLNWQNVLGTHHASAHGGSFDLIVKMLD